MRINEIFLSLQGEGVLAGTPTVFLRLSTCSVRAGERVISDTYWEGALMTVEAVSTEVKKYSANLVSVLGEGPLTQKETIPLLEHLLAEGYTVSLETSGDASIKDVPLSVIKKIEVAPNGAIAWENFNLLRAKDTLKFLIAEKEDFQRARRICDEHELQEKCTVLYCPVHGKLSPLELAEWLQGSEARSSAEEADRSTDTHVD